jgi:hypothetical protein
MDPYRLPEASMPTVSTEEKPDARLATEAELKQFIDEVHPEDIDIESPEFRALPTEVQYEIVGDMRVRSRQTSHKRSFRFGFFNGPDQESQSEECAHTTIVDGYRYGWTGSFDDTSPYSRREE